jgi:hypothetical protein
MDESGMSFWTYSPFHATQNVTNPTCVFVALVLGVGGLGLSHEPQHVSSTMHFGAMALAANYTKRSSAEVLHCHEPPRLRQVTLLKRIT